MTVSVRIFCQEMKSQRIFDNDLGWTDSSSPIREGYIFQSDKVTDDVAQEILCQAEEIDFSGNYITGFVHKGKYQFAIHCWLDNPRLEDYPLMPHANEALYSFFS